MRLVRLLPERWQKFIHEAAKFGIVGGINTVINYAVFNVLALTVFVNGELKATVIATIVATITSYLMNRHWTYRDRPKSAMQREYALFFLFNATGLLIELGVLAAAKYGLGMTSLLAFNVAKTGGVVLATLFRFWSYRTFVFQAAPVTTPAVETRAADPAVPPTTARTTDGTAQPATASGGALPATASGGALPATTGSATFEADRLAELDPVAELAESVTALEEAQPSPRTTGSVPGPERPTNGVRTRVTPRRAGFANSVDIDLAAELAAELQDATRRGTGR